MMITDTDIQFAQGVRSFYKLEGYKPPDVVKIEYDESRVSFQLIGNSAVPVSVYCRIHKRIYTHGNLLYGADRLRGRVLDWHVGFSGEACVAVTDKDGSFEARVLEP